MGEELSDAFAEFYERQDYAMATNEKWGGTETRPYEEWVIEYRAQKAAPYESYWREQIARDVKGLVRREYEQVGRDYMENWQMVKRDDGDYVLFGDVIAAIARGK